MNIKNGSVFLDFMLTQHVSKKSLVKTFFLSKLDFQHALICFEVFDERPIAPFEKILKNVAAPM